MDYHVLGRWHRWCTLLVGIQVALLVYIGAGVGLRLAAMHAVDNGDIRAWRWWVDLRALLRSPPDVWGSLCVPRNGTPTERDFLGACLCTFFMLLLAVTPALLRDGSLSRWFRRQRSVHAAAALALPVALLSCGLVMKVVEMTRMHLDAPDGGWVGLLTVVGFLSVFWVLWTWAVWNSLLSHRVVAPGIDTQTVSDIAAVERGLAIALAGAILATMLFVLGRAEVRILMVVNDGMVGAAAISAWGNLSWLALAGPEFLAVMDGARCAKCGYDLHGSPGATACPECGQVIVPKVNS